MQPGGQYQWEKLHDGAVATGDGKSMFPVSMNGHYNKLAVQIVGIVTATVTWECTVDGSTWKGLLARPTTSDTAALTATADGIYRMDVTGLAAVRGRISAWTEGTIDMDGYLTTV